MYKFNRLYNILLNQINEEISTFLVKDNKLKNSDNNSSDNNSSDVQTECNARNYC